jgi:hypothetical protein
MDVSTSLRRQKSAHPMPPVNLCAGLDGCRVEVFGEQMGGDLGFIAANIAYDEARRAGDLALGLLSKTLARKAG